MFVVISNVSSGIGCMDLSLKHNGVYTAKTHYAIMLISIVNKCLSLMDAY